MLKIGLTRHFEFTKEASRMWFCFGDSSLEMDVIYITLWANGGEDICPLPRNLRQKL